MTKDYYNYTAQYFRLQAPPPKSLCIQEVPALPAPNVRHTHPYFSQAYLYSVLKKRRKIVIGGMD